jgi:uncharacterized protein YutE (UPF0331/DUF86 family)
MATDLRRERLGLPQSASGRFDVPLRRTGLTPHWLGRIEKMVGFRNIAVHDYQRMLVPIAINNVITRHLDEFCNQRGRVEAR